MHGKTILKNPGRAGKIHNVILIVTLILGIPVVCFGYVFLYLVSGEFAEASPEIAFMRTPLLIFTYLIVTAILALVIVLLVFAIKSIRKNIFDQGSIRMIYTMGHLLSFAFLTAVVMIIYTYAKIGSEAGLVGSYMILMTLILFSAANLIYFVARIFQSAVSYKEENDLTV